MIKKGIDMRNLYYGSDKVEGERPQKKCCPHCGGEANLYTEYNQGGKYDVFVKCESCGARSGVYISEDYPGIDNWNNEACLDAVKAWNTRCE